MELKAEVSWKKLNCNVTCQLKISQTIQPQKLHLVSSSRHVNVMIQTWSIFFFCHATLEQLTGRTSDPQT